MTYTKTRANANTPNNYVSVLDFGAVGDGVTDDTVAIQAAIDSNQLVCVPKGKYRITSSLIFDPQRNRNSGLLGTTASAIYSDNSQPGGPTWNGDEMSRIWFDGPASDTTAVIHASAEPVGTEVGNGFADSIFGFYLDNIFIDGNNKAGFGIYGIRLVKPYVTNTIVENTTQHGVYLDQIFSGSFEYIECRKNLGCGFTAGRGLLDYEWETGNRCNAVYFNNINGTANGVDKTYNETTNPLWGYGIGLWLHRGNLVESCTSEVNDGHGIVLCSTDQDNSIQSLYTELNGTDAIKEGRANSRYGLWYLGENIDGLHMSINNGFIAEEGIRLTGTEPFNGRSAGALELNNIAGGTKINSDWSNYRVVNCNRELLENLEGTAPSGASVQPAGIRFSEVAEDGQSALNYYQTGGFSPTLQGSGEGGEATGNFL